MGKGVTNVYTKTSPSNSQSNSQRSHNSSSSSPSDEQKPTPTSSATTTPVRQTPLKAKNKPQMPKIPEQMDLPPTTVLKREASDKSDTSNSQSLSGGQIQIGSVTNSAGELKNSNKGKDKSVSKEH
jgi:hypothetical protein